MQPTRRMRWVSRGGARIRMRAGGRRVCSRPAECAGSAAAGACRQAGVQEGGVCAADPPNALGQPRWGHACACVQEGGARAADGSAVFDAHPEIVDTNGMKKGL